MGDRVELMVARGVRFSYGGREVLRGVDVGVGAGEVVVVLGPNGSGKTTLIKVLAGVMKAGGGEVVWEGREVGAWSRREMGRRVGYLPQNPTWEQGWTVGDVLRLGRAPYWGVMGLETEKDARVVGEVAGMLGLGEMMGTRVEELSGGQRQRVFIGRCLVQEPKALLLDEPNTFLDLRHQVEVGRLIRKLAKERGVGVVMALHDLNLAAAFADRMIVLAEGKVVKEGVSAEVMDAGVLSGVYGVELERVERAGVVGVLPVVGGENRG